MTGQFNVPDTLALIFFSFIPQHLYSSAGVIITIIIIKKKKPTRVINKTRDKERKRHTRCLGAAKPPR